MFYRRILVLCGFVIVGHSGMCSRLPDDPPPMARFLKATQLAGVAYRDLIPGTLKEQGTILGGLEFGAVEGAIVRAPYFAGEEGKVLKDYFSSESSGFRGYIMEDEEEVIVTIRGTKDPLHMLLDLHILMATAGEDPKTTLINLMTKSLDLGVMGKCLLKKGVEWGGSKIYASVPGGFESSAEEPKAVEDASLVSVLFSATQEALFAGVMETIPEIKALYSIVWERDATALKQLLENRFVQAVNDAKRCIETSQSSFNTRGKRLRVVGHSLGGALGTIAMAQLHAERKLEAVDFEVNAICSPGSAPLLAHLKTSRDRDFEARVFTLVRKGDIVSNFGEHVGYTLFLDAAEQSPAAASSGWLSYLNPSAYTITPIMSGLQYLKNNHSSQKAIDDVKRLLDAA